METRYSRLLAALVCGLLFGGFLSPAGAAPGDLDLTFGNGGIVTTTIGSGNDLARSVVVQGDGKVVVAGYSNNGTDDDFAVVRYNPDGTLDTSFGTGGKVTTPIGKGDDRGRSVVLQKDGKIVVAGIASTDFAVVRYNADGSLDAGFGSGGKVITAVGSANGVDVAAGVVLQGDGKIVVAGYARSTSDNTDDFAVVRYNTNGSLDSSFGNGGKVMTAIGSGYDNASSVALQSDGKIVVAGDSANETSRDFALVRYNTDGTLDTSFGTGGKVITDFENSFDTACSVAVQSNGKIVVAGEYGSRNIALARYNSNGRLDTTFSGDGKEATWMGGTTSIRSMVVQGDGKIVVAGYGVSTASGNYDFFLARYNANGSRDASFSDDGRVTTAIGDGQDFGWAVTLQGDGKILAAGYASNGANDDFALARYEVISKKPIVTSGPVISVTPTSAHLSGSVDPDGALTTIVFETAKSGEPYEASGNVKAHQSPLWSSDIQSVSGTRTGLLPRTTYKFRVTATSSAGTSVGEDVTFTTANSQPVANDKTVHPDGLGLSQTIFSPLTDASDADGDPLTVAVLSYTGTGLVDVLDGAVVYSGGPLDGEETVTVEVSDGFGGKDQATITLKNAAPVSTPDTVVGFYGRPSSVPALANDSDSDGDAFSVVSFTQPSNGEVARADGVPNVLVYTPRLGFSGEDTFTYTVTDGRSAPVTGTVTITVGPRLETQINVALNTGTPLPGAGEEGSGIPGGATWKSFGEPAISDAGHVAVLGFWKSPKGSASGIFVDEQLVVEAGDPVPGIASATFKSFQDPLINLTGRVAFLATISGPGVKKGYDTVLVSDAFSGELELIAREGDVAPEADDARYGKFYNISLRSDLDSTGLLFTASLLKGSGSPKVTLHPARWCVKAIRVSLRERRLRASCC